MRPRTVVILAIVFVVLLVVVFFSRSPAASASGDMFAVARVRPSQIAALRLQTKDDRITLERRSIGWVLTDADSAWPADERRVNAGLRVLTSAVARESDTGLDETALDCTVLTDTGEISIRIAAEGLAGTRFASIDGRPAQIDSALADLLDPAGVRAWADTRALPGLDPGVTSIVVDRWDGRFELARVGQRWGVRSPIVTPADASRVAAFLGGLASAQARIGSTDMTSPAFTIIASRGDSTWTLLADGKGRGGGSIQVSGEDLGTSYTLDDAALRTITTELTELLSARSIDLPRSDIARLVLTTNSGDTALERIGRSWTGDAEVADALLALLTTEEADEVLLQDDAPASSMLFVERFGGLPGGSFALWTDDGHLHVNHGGVTRRYLVSASPAATVAEWLSDRGG